MAAETTGDVSLIQDEDVLRKMWQDTDDFGKKKEIRSHMYKIREARLKDFYNTGEEITSSSENKQHSSSSTIRTTSHSTTTGLKGSDLTTYADNLADHSFLSLKSKEIRDSESPTKDSYKIITETKKLNDRDWNVVESNEASQDGKTHTTSRIATTSGRQDLEGGEMKYAAKSEQKASVFKDGDDKNFTKSVQASSQNVIKQEAKGGDDNSKYYSSSTTTTSSSKFSNEQRSSSDDAKHYEPITTTNVQEFDGQPSRNTRTIVRKVYTEDIPNQTKIIDPNTKVTTETHTLPDGSTVTTTRYETKGSTQYKTSSSSSSSTKQVGSSTEQKATSNVVKSHVVTADDDNRSTRSDSISSRKETHHNESDIRRMQDLELLGRDAKNVEIIVKNQTIPHEQARTVTTTSVTKTVSSDYDQQIPIKDGKTTVTTTKTFTIPADQEETKSTSTIITKKITSNYDKQQVASTDFLDSERQHLTQTKTKTTTIEDVPLPARKEITQTETVTIRKDLTPTKPKPESIPESYPRPTETIEIEIIPIAKAEPKYEQPERRQPIKPHKGELEERPTPTEGQYDTTYRSDYVPRRISVEVSPTHDAFARSLRSISPDRISKTGSVRSLRTTSTTSLRSSPDRHPNRVSRASPSDSMKKTTKSPGPEVIPKKRMSESPEKKTQRIVNKQTEERNKDTITRKKKTDETDSSTLTRKTRPVDKPRSRSVSPTSIASDIEFIRHRTDLVTDLDVDDITKLQRRHTQEFDKPPLTDSTSPKKSQRITDKSATLPLPAKSPTKESPLAIQTEKPRPKSIRRTDTYEERCKEILGIGDTTKEVPKKPVGKSPQKSPEKETPHQEKPKVAKKTSSVQEFPSQIRKSPQKEPLEYYPAKPKDEKRSPSVQEFPSQIRKSPQKEPIEPYPEKPRSDKIKPSVQEFPAQIRKTPQKDPIQSYPVKSKDDKRSPSVQEFPSQIRKSPQKEPVEPYPHKPKSEKIKSSVQEFPSQTRKSHQKEPLEPYPEKPRDEKKPASVQEFPSQTRKSPQKQPLEPYPEKSRDDKKAPSVQEFPSQIRKSPQKEPLEAYPEKLKDVKRPSSIQEFPSQVKKSPQKEPVEPYPEKPKVDKSVPSVQEFPSQIRKSPQKEPLEPYPQKLKDDKKSSSVQEFPSQVKKSPQKEPLEPYSEKPKADKTAPSVQEFPSQMRKSPQKEPLEQYPEKLPTQVKKPTESIESIEPVATLDYPRYYSDENDSDLDHPLQKGPTKVSLDDLPTIKTDKVSLDDLTNITVTKKPFKEIPEKVSLDDLHPKKSQKLVDNFITNEKIDTEVTLTKYKDESIHRLKGIPDVKTKKPKKITKKTTSETCVDSETETSTTEDEDVLEATEDETEIIEEIHKIKKPIKPSGIDDIEDQIITDETDDVDVTVRRITTTESQQLKSPKKEETAPQKKTSPPNKTRPKSKPDVEDFITVTKAQLQETESRMPVEEVVHSKKFVRELCKKEEKTPTSPKIVKKDQPTTSKTPSEIKKKDTTNKSRIDSRRITPKEAISKQTTKKIQDDHYTIKTEYTDQFTTKIKDKRATKPATTKVSTRITLAPVKQPESKKPAPDTTLHFKVQKIDSTTTKKGVNVIKLTQIDKKPSAKLPSTYTKKLDDQQFKSKFKMPETKAQPTRTTAPVTKPTTTAPAKRHVVSTIINLKPKQKPETVTKTIHKTTVTKTIIAPKSTKSTPLRAAKPTKSKPALNGDISTEEEEDSDTENITIKTTRNQTGSVRTDKKKKCITTKSILIENAVADEREIIVDLKRSKSSREGTPDQICPYPVSTDSDLGIPRYPDRVTEPDDAQHRLKPKRISDIPLDETKDVHNFERIVEIDKTMKTDVESTDECLLSVNEKVSKFLSTAEQITKKPLEAKPAPKVERPKLEVDESLKEDECLLSVSDKVNKFIATAEQLASSTTKETIQTTNKTQRYKEEREEILETRKSLSPERKPQTKGKSPDHQLTSKSRTPEVEPIRFKTPERKPSDSYTRKPTEDVAQTRKQPVEDDTTPKTSRRLSKDDSKPVLSPTGRLRSTETIKKAKALFENYGNEREVTRQKDILNRPSVFEGRRTKQSEEKVEKKDVRTKLIYDEHQLRRSPSPQLSKQKTIRSHSPEGETPHYMLPLDRSVRENDNRSRKENLDEDLGVTEVDRSRGTTPDRNVPHYMLPLDRSLRERSPHKDNVKQLEYIANRSITTTHSDDEFGVTLRDRDSRRMVQTTSRKLSTSSVDEKSIDVDVEEIFDLEYLVKLLEIIVGYDIRRRIRAQIRLIKRAIEDNTLETLIVSRRRSPIKEITSTRIEKRETSDYQTSYQRKTSASEFSTNTKSPSPVRSEREPSPKKPQDRKSRTPERDVVRSTTTTSTRIFQTDLKKPKTVTKTVTEEKPEWVTQRTLRKVSETAPIKKTVTSTTTTTTHKSSTKKQPTDDITSSYGVGPTDENGTPLFGLKALRAQNKSEKTKVQGTVIRSQFYSENGEEPEGEISVTKFSTDPKDLGRENVIADKGVASVTTTQKFGYKGTPSLKTITNKSKKTSSNEDAEYKTSSVKVSKIARKGSVKEISQKFLDNAVESLKSERQSSYPKAGLILRTSSFKDSPSNGVDLNRSREGSPDAQEIHEKVVTSVRETTSTTSGGKKSDTFLSNKSKVTGVHDVLSRMKNEAEIEVEETEEDAEARNLLNKFIGSQVLLSGMESQLSKLPDTSPVGSVKHTTKITTTTTSSDSSKPSSVTCTFTHPITVELLQNIWDEQTLKLLLEQSTDYEDRRIIRTRLREVMAEQEACAELVEKATSEDTSISKETGNTVHDGVTNRADDSESGEVSEDEDDDDDQATVKTALHNETRSSPEQNGQHIQQPQPDLIMQTNPLYNRPSEERDTTNNNSENDDYPTQLNEKANRFNSKKLKMKRANTIDIPKPLNYYEDDDDDSDNENLSSRRNSYLALRGPIRVGKLNVEKKVPEFQPKTESDKKFMAFLGKHADNASNNNNSNNNNKTSLWCNQQSTINNNAKNSNNWSNKFGNIKNNFEKIQTSNSVNSARNFWKSADDAVMAGRAPQFGPKISRQSAKNLQQMFEEKQKQNQANQNQSNVVTGHLKVDTSKTNKNVTVVTQPNAINKFSHAPMSAFKPVAKKLEFLQHQPQQQNHLQQNQPQYSSYIKPKPLRIAPMNTQPTDNNKNTIKPPDSPLYLYSPKQVSPQTTSPTNSAPWNSEKNSGETAPPCSRVLSIAAAKFQNINQDRDLPPRKMSKEKIVIPPSLLNQQAQPQEKLTSPYIVKSVAQGSTVRKLSGQYDSLGNRDVYNPVNSDSKTQYGINKVYNKFTTQYKPKVPLYNEPKQQYAAKTVMNSDNQGKTVLYGDTTRSSEDKQQYYASSTRATDDYGFPRRSSIDKKHYGDVRRSSESDKQHYGDIGRFSEGVSRSSDCKEQYYPQTPATTTNAMQSYYESPSKLSSDDKQHNRKQKIDDDRQIYQTNVVVSNNDKQYYDSPLYVNTQEHPYNDDVPECDAPKMFVPGENYSIQYENPPRTPVYSTECAVTQQSYDSPQTVVKSEEDAAKIADYHNRQQQIISRIQQVSPNVREPEVYREEPKYDDESHQYTSNYHFRPQMSPSKNPKCEIDREETENLFSNETRSPYSNYERQTSQESVKEYTAVSSKVMSGPVSQQAVTVQQNTPRSRDQHDMEFNLKTTLSKLSAFSDKQEKVATSSPVLERKTSLKQTPLVVYNNVKQRPSVCINDKPLSLELLDVNEKGEQILTSKFHIPIRRQSDNLTAAHSGGHELSKSESWHQICQQNQQTSNKPSPRASPSTRSVLRSKSSHSLAVPKQFEAGMSKTEMLEKKKTMEAYFGAAPTKKDNKKISSSINRVKTSQKVSTQRQISGGGTTGLCRSKTLPDIVCLDKLDDTNIDAIFEDLFNSRTTTRTTTYTQGPVTTTSQVTTTKVTSQEQMKKPMSPFAKFRQLDKQNSLNSPPSTPKSPTAGGPLFKFTDPSLNQSANTVKQRLLQWCQMKTKEYENIQLDNFSTSWSDGMAFCALIHHFLPDTFDYNTLNPKNRRHNFTLAFRVADEKAGIAPLLDVDDMVAIRKPDWKCVFTYVQSIYRRFKDDD